MKEIKPIETLYNGYRFRSRLEARWAVFFDAAGIEYQYEPEGFEHCGCRYLPDFYLPEFGLYVEVKPSKTKLMEDQEKLAWMVDYGGPMGGGLLILGQIPRISNSEFNIPAFMLFKWNRGISVSDVSFVNKEESAPKVHAGILNIRDYPGMVSAPMLPLNAFATEDLYYNEYSIMQDFEGFTWSLPKHYTNDVLKCFDTARKARFEHGEKPKVKG